MLSCVLAVEQEVLQAPSAHPTLLAEAVASHAERGLGAASSGSAPTLPSCPGLVALSPSACEALEHALQCWVAAQAQPLPRASLGPAASLAVRAYGLLGAHRLALALFRALHSSRTLALDPASLASCLLSAKLVGDSTAFLEVLEALEASAAAAGGAGGGAPSQPQPQPHHTEAGRLENLLEAIVRGSGGEGRAEPVLAALHALQWPLSLRLFTLQARAALAQRRISTAAAAMRELVRVQRSMAQEQEQALALGLGQEQALEQPLAAREREEQAALAGLTVRRAIEAGNPEAACTALYALRYLAASTGAEPGGVARHVDLAWALRCSYTLGCVPLVEALAADALRHQASRSRIWEAIAREAGAGAGAGASEELVHAAVSVRVLCYLAEASALSGEDHVGALRAMALIDMHSLPFVARRGGRGGGSGSGRAQADFSLPEALAPLPTTMPKAVTALRKSITSFFQWEEKLEKESGRGGAGEEEAGEAAAASAGEGAVGLDAMLESEQGQEQFSSEAGPESAAHSSAEQQQLEQQQQLEHPVAADEEPAPLGASPPTHSPSSMAAYASMASLLGLPLAPYAPSSASQQQQQQQQQREVVELQALAGGYTVTSFQARLLALASAQAHVIFSGARVRVGALEAGSEQQQQQQGEWGSPASGAAAAAPAWGDPGLAPEQQPAGELAAPGASGALAAMEGSAWVAQLAQCVDAATLRATAPHPSSDPAAALPVGGGGGGGGGAGALLASPLRGLTFSAALVGQDGAWQDSAPLPEGNLRLLETLTQSLSVWVVAGRGEGSGSGSGSAPRRERAPLSPSALTAVLGATASNTRTRPQCLRILEAALERYGCLYLPLDGFACAIEALVALGTIEARREAYAQLLSSAQQQRGGKGGAGSGGGGAAGGAGASAAAAAVRAHPIDTGSVAALLQRLADRDARPNARVYAAVSHACLRAGSTAKAAAVLRHALAQGTVPPEFAFQRLLREVLSLHEAGLCPARLSDQAAPVDGALRDSSLLQLVNSGGMRGMVESVQEVVHLFNQAG